MSKHAYQFSVLNNKLCAVKNKLSSLTYVKDITDLQLIGTDLHLTFINEKDESETIVVSLGPLAGIGLFRPDIVVDNYNELLTVTGQSLFEFAEVLNNQGTSWLPGSIGGTFYGKGLYYWNGTEWKNDNDQIFEALQNIIDVNIAQQAQIDSLVFGSQYNIFESKPISVSDTTIPVEKLNVNTTVLPIGKYVLKINYSWNGNRTNEDFESSLTIDSNPVGLDPSGLIHKQEPKDAAGQFLNTRSSQQLNFSREYIFDVLAASSKNIVLSFNSSSNSRVSMWDASIQVYRVN